MRDWERLGSKFYFGTEVGRGLWDVEFGRDWNILGLGKVCFVVGMSFDTWSRGGDGCLELVR